MQIHHKAKLFLGKLELISDYYVFWL